MTFLMALTLLISTAFAQGADFKYLVSCENPADCPGWVVGLLHAKGACSGFLVKPDVVATNLHCLPPEIRTAGSSCEGKIHFTFPDTHFFKEEDLGCDTVLSVSPPITEKFLQTDYAFLKLPNKVNRTTVEISQKGLADFENVVVYKVDPVPNSARPTGVIRRQECKAIQNSMINPYFRTDESPLVMISDCQIRPGNSGSAILGSDRSVRGIVSSISEIETSKLAFADKKNKENIKFSFGTNLSCVSIPTFNQRIEGKPDCQVGIGADNQKAIATQMYKGALDQAHKDLSKKLYSAMNNIKMAGITLFHWNVRSSVASEADIKKGIIGEVIFEPTCLFPGLKDLEKYGGKLKNSDIAMTIKVPLFQFTAGHDEYVRYKAQAQDLSREFKFVLNPSDILKKKDIPLRFVQSSGSPTKMSVTNIRTLNLCGQEN